MYTIARDEIAAQHAADLHRQAAKQRLLRELRASRSRSSWKRPWKVDDGIIRIGRARGLRRSRSRVRRLADGPAGACHRSSGRDRRLLILTTFDLDAYVYEALRGGSSGFLLKDAPPEQLVEAIRIVARGDALLAPSITRRLIERFLRQPVLAPPGSKPLHQLTTREREVLELIAYGLSNSEIAARLYLTEATVKTHVAHIYRKLGLRDRAQAVVYAHEAGLLGTPADNEQKTPSSRESN
jgi:DNA-binding NarL/FixJ family response regulator